MASSGMLRRVPLVRTDVSQELSASILRVTRIGELGTLAVTKLLSATLLVHSRGSTVEPWSSVRVLWS
jgi:hypothetical protein